MAPDLRRAACCIGLISYVNIVNFSGISMFCDGKLVFCSGLFIMCGNWKCGCHAFQTFHCFQWFPLDGVILFEHCEFFCTGMPQIFALAAEARFWSKILVMFHQGRFLNQTPCALTLNQTAGHCLICIAGRKNGGGGRSQISSRVICSNLMR